ncbi:hypothetical protein D3C79_772300 [compost metagenome]
MASTIWRVPAWAWKPTRLASIRAAARGEEIFMVTSLWVKSAGALAALSIDLAALFTDQGALSLFGPKWAETCYHRSD